MRQAVHPGEVLWEDVIKPLGLSLTDAAQRLGINPKTLSALVHQRTRMSVTMALHVAYATSTTPESWWRMQATYDLIKAQEHEPANVSRFPEKIAS